MRILVHAPIPTDGTSFYRSLGPLSHLQKKYHDIEIVNGSAPGFEYNWHTLLDIDIVFLQRPSMAESLEIIKVAKRSRKPIWIDYDDDYIKIPETNPRHDLYNNPVRQSQIRECMKLADIITVSTEEIEKTIRENVDITAEIVCVSNAYDPYLFEINRTNPEREKTVFWRGGDTHVKDVELYKDAILKCFDKFPEYKWVFYGHKFDWMIDHALEKGQQERIITYEFTDLMHYFNSMMQLNPEIMIVPLEDNTFNRGKSNISWIEGTLAGATVMATGLPEFNRGGCLLFNNQDEFEDVFSLIATNKEVSKKMHRLSEQTIPSLDRVNDIRYSIAHRLMEKSQKRFPIKAEAKPWDDKRFFEYTLTMGYIQENPSYAAGHHGVADWLFERFKPATMMEFGCGPGAMLERFLMNNVMSIGLEINDYSIDYFKTRNPVFEDRIIKCDFAVKDPNDLTFEKTDLGISLEVFEHIDMPEEWWDVFINKLAQSFKHFYFSSTPDRSSVKFDLQWGHCNVRQSKAWIHLFERNGWKYLENPKKICPWDMLFESTYKEA